jgi:hypothetical protein
MRNMRNMVVKKIQTGGRNEFDLHDHKNWNMRTRNM